MNSSCKTVFEDFPEGHNFFVCAFDSKQLARASVIFGSCFPHPRRAKNADALAG